MKIKDLLTAHRNQLRNRSKRSTKINEVGKSGGSSGVARDPKSTRVKNVTPSLGGNNGQFEEPVVDMLTVFNAYSSDGYIRRAIDTVSTLMLKSGYELKGKNPDSLNYVKQRLFLMEEATDMSFLDLVTELCDNFVLFSNAPFVKARGTENLESVQAAGYYGGDPIVGIFPISPRYFQVKRDEFGAIEGYQVTNDGSEKVELAPEDVGHLSYRRPTGTAYGTPYIQNVLDDVLILRNIEENVSQLIYRNLFPLTTYTVGTATQGYEATDDEIEAVADKIAGMRLDEIHVIPERHSIKTINNGNAAMDVSNYLEYFRQRVFTGLGMSESVMGVSGTANKSTADNQNSDLNDLVKDFQKRFQSQIQHTLINEILFEGGYDPVINPDDIVTFEFVEIEQAAKIARENHYINLFNNQAIDFPELRVRLGLDPTTDFSQFHFMLHSTNQSSTTPAENAVDNADKPENQHGKQDSPSKNQTKDKKLKTKGLTEEKQLVKFPVLESTKAMDSPLLDYWNAIRDDIMAHLSKNHSLKDALGFSLGLSRERLSLLLDLQVKEAMHLTSNVSLINFQELQSLLRYVSDQNQKTIERLYSSIYIRLDALNESSNPTEYVESTFKSFEKRLQRITDFNHAYGENLEYCLAQFGKGTEFVEIETTESSDCDKCLKTVISRKDVDWFKSVPPYHPGCNCKPK